MSDTKKSRKSISESVESDPSFLSDHPSPRGELQRVRDTLREQTLRFDLVLEKMRQGLCFFDGSKRLILANDRFAEIYDIAPGAIRPGMQLRDILELRVAAGSFPEMTQAEYLDWREGVADAQKPTDSIVPLRNGRIIHIHHEPLSDSGWVATHDDVTEQRRSEDELRRRNLQFDAAIANMSQGLCMFDANERMVVCNLNYPLMFGMSPEFVKPGISLREVLQHSVDINVASETVDELYRIRREIITERKPKTYCETLADGRIIDIWHRPMADGGWVSTYDDITERRRAETRISYLATHDPLTGLPNRAFLHAHLSQLLSDQARNGLQGSTSFTSLLLLDLDRFKEVNDTLGHAAGDKLLRMVAERLRSVLVETDMAARLGGDEFAILHLDSDIDAIAALAGRIIDVLIAPYDVEGQQANVGVSIGISVAPPDGSDPDGLLGCADLALYRAKAQGRGTFAFFEVEMTASAHHRRVLELELREALILGQFEVYYQPQICSATRLVSGAEALIRWHHPTRGLVGPTEFIVVAEEVGLIVPIGEWIMRQACQDAARWQSNIRVSVNLSAVQFRNGRLSETIISALAAAELPPGRLELEITESVLLEETKNTLETLHQMRQLGVRVSLDDFGTGYSSLSYLRSFPFDKIKIDRSFVREIATSANGAALVRTIASLGASLGMETTAEGIETEEQRDLVLAEGCTEMQGFLFSRPLPLRELLNFVGLFDGEDSLAPSKENRRQEYVLRPPSKRLAG